jgi:hypothetical protein
MNATVNIESDPIEPVMRAFRQLSPGSQGAVATLVRQLAKSEGISVEQTGNPGIRSPAEGIPLWLAKLKAERYSARTVHIYRYLIRRYLDSHPAPTKFELQSYLAKRLEEVSPALAVGPTVRQFLRLITLNMLGL